MIRLIVVQVDERTGARRVLGRVEDPPLVAAALDHLTATKSSPPPPRPPRRIGSRYCLTRRRGDHDPGPHAA